MRPHGPKMSSTVPRQTGNRMYSKVALDMVAGATSNVMQPPSSTASTMQADHQQQQQQQHGMSMQQQQQDRDAFNLGRSIGMSALTNEGGGYDYNSFY